MIDVRVLRQHRAAWGLKLHAVYVIWYNVYAENSIYVGRVIEDGRGQSTLGNWYVSSGEVSRRMGWRRGGYNKLSRKCDLLYNSQFIDHIDIYYVDPCYHKFWEKQFILRFAREYGVSSCALHLSDNNFTRLFYSDKGRVINIDANSAEHLYNGDFKESQIMGARKVCAFRKSRGDYHSKEHLDACSRGGKIGVKKISVEALRRGGSIGGSIGGAKAMANTTSEQFKQRITKGWEIRKIKGNSPQRRGVSVSISNDLWVSVCSRNKMCKYMTTRTGIQFWVASLEQSLNRNRGECWYKGYYFKYTDLLTEEEFSKSILIK